MEFRGRGSVGYHGLLPHIVREYFNVPRLLLCIILFCCAATSFGSVAAQDARVNSVDLSTLFDGIDLRPSESAFIAPPREVIRPLVRCKKLLAKNEVAEAVEILGELLADDTAEDFLIPRGSTSFESLRSRTERILGSIDERFLEPYQVRYDIRARKLLDEGVAKSDSALLKKVSNQFFFTASGSEAAMLLGHMDLSSGQPSAAQSWFAKVVRYRSTANRHDPEASILLATCQLLGSNERGAKETLLSLKKRMPNSSIEFQGKNYPLFNRDGQAVAWLTSLIGDSPLGSNRAFSEWLMFQGNPSRTGKTGTGMPLLSPRWQHAIGGSLSLQEETKGYLQELVQDGLAPAPASQPLVVGDTIVYRDIERLYGVDFKTGRHQWSWPPQLGWNQKSNAEVRFPQRSKIQQRLVLDSIFGQASSDGRLIFFVPHPGSSSEYYDNPFADATQSAPEDVRQYNELVAIDAEQSGLLSWRVGGPNGLDEPKLAKTYFIGEPLPLEGVLYCCCVRDNAIQLVALDSKTGKLRWAQAIASYNSESFSANHYRRLAGVTPSYGDGKIVCLTGTGGVVALEVATRNLLWGYEYRLPKNDDVVSDSSNYANVLNDVWRDSQVTISNGMVYLTPVLSRHLICLNLENGEGVWFEEDGFIPRRLGRQSSLYLAGVERNRLILLGAKDVRSVDALSGEERWKLQLPEGDVLSGRGYIGEGSLYVPTTTQKMLRIDLQSGKIAESVVTGRILGNLSRVQGDVISHGLDHVASYPELNATRKSLGDDEGGDDKKKKFTRAQLLIQDGKAEQGLNLLAELSKTDPNGSLAEVFASLVVNFGAKNPGLSVKSLDALKEYYPEFDVTELEKSRMLSKLRIGDYEESLNLGLDQLEQSFEDVCNGGKAELSNKIDRRIAATLIDPEQVGDQASGGKGGIDVVGFENRNDSLEYSSFGWQRAKLIMAMQGLVASKDKEAIEAARTRISSLVLKAIEKSDEQFEWLIARLHEQVLDAETLEMISRRYLKQKKYLGALMYADSAIRVGESNSESLKLLKAEVLLEGGDFQAARETLGVFDRAMVDESDVSRFENLKEKVAARVESNQDALLRLKNGDAKFLPSTTAIKATKTEQESQQRIYRLPAVFDSSTPKRIQDMQIAWCPWGLKDRELEVRNAQGTLARQLQIRRNDDNRSFGYSNTCWIEFQNHVAELTLNKLTYFIDWFKVISGEGGNLWTLPDEQISRLRTAFSGGREYIYSHQGWLNCHETLTGKLIWKRRLGKKTKRLVAHGQQVTAWSEEGRMFKTVDAATGRLIRTMKSKRYMVSRTIGDKFVISHPIRKGELSKEREKQFTQPEGVTNPARVAMQFGVYDAAVGRVNWERTFHVDSKFLYLGQEMCVLDRSGRIKFYDLASGDVLGDVQLPLTKEEMELVLAFNLRRHQAGWIVHLNLKDNLNRFTRGDSTYRFISLHRNLTTGPVFLVDDSRSKLLWRSPVYVEQMEYMDNQPTDSPAILFGRHIERRGPKEETHHMQTVVLDVASGKVIGSTVVATLENYNGHAIEWTAAKRPSQRQLVLSTAIESQTVSFGIDEEQPPLPGTYLTFNAVNFFDDTVFEKPRAKMFDLRENEFRIRAKEAAMEKAARKSEAAAELRSRMKIRSD